MAHLKKRATMAKKINRLTSSGDASIELEESIVSKLENIEIDKIAVLKLAYEDIKKEIFSYTRTDPFSQSVHVFNLCKFKSVECYLQYRISDAKIICYKIVCQKNQRPESQNVIEVKRYNNGEILPTKLDISGNISTTTIWKYLHKWGYVFRNSSKDIFYNGH
ncbi:hypothetical protein PHYBLDRAFT_161791 [Phycomyces blakesleeanus NRRL 1555(-)]|uniref:Uncharacterized protein n=1 Tax=Phycomyces blakesleeanus (strain ATCC 8743b / DSM 1359 / FGSC 10004 / NBRC 33097 / NRRL 1555) TaxID=763407 RepID=A0A163ERZ0_PHYB8|nr:hypothetical protein PHYBLDRAFT_161791 [Phycomyces blakesleeanus NRRL 1555(-)]OAD81160.1 hypothetical protein PHYBLDRAFT_161791 [Phycomyces blakesleeanus NRRL 1555(-)]|eukprot:XP_018299200.1 hypothetical protein PHYBLDRAFT_161791 [Phycomyces blakesleeanus NRRL 1555(-)]